MEKVAFWRTKATISVKRVKIEEKLLWMAYELINALSNVTIPDSLRPPLPRDWGLQLYSYPLLSQAQVKLRTSNLAGTFTGSIRIKTH